MWRGKEFESVTYCCKGGGNIATPVAPPPPSQISAAENVAKTRAVADQKRAFGFNRTVLTSGMGLQAQANGQAKTLLGA